MEESILKILRDKDHYKASVEIKENAKGEPSVTVTYRDDEPEIAVKMALKSYKDTVDGITLGEKK